MFVAYLANESARIDFASIGVEYAIGASISEAVRKLAHDMQRAQNS